VDNQRFRDTGETIIDFLDSVLVECPRCKQCANITGNPIKQRPKLICSKCGLISTPEIVSYGGSSGEYCGFSLWLKSNCCGNILWVYNKKHLNYLESYVGANLREEFTNINQSLVSRLPYWIKKSQNRESILKCILKLRQKLNN